MTAQGKNNHDETNTFNKLHVGEWVEVRCQNEILATLDERGCLDNLPFMPEMLQFCGKKYLVYKRADKTCDTITGNYHSRRMQNAVHLADLRCDGVAHGGCDATCMIFWKEAWLKRVDKTGVARKPGNAGDRGPVVADTPNLGCTLEDLYQATKSENSDSLDEDVYSCQATELLRATRPLPWWDIRQYWRDLASGNFNPSDFVRILAIGIINWFSVKLRGIRIYPFFDTRLMVESGTPKGNLDLQPGEMVQVKNLPEILRTLDKLGKNRGLYYDMNGEMLKYCNKKAKVLKRVRKVIDEKTGKLLVLKNECVILQGMICCGHFSPNRLLCPRAQYPFWREIWLTRIDA